MVSNTNLTKNEKKTLKLLMSNSRVTDREISKHLKISSQAVGKIRRKLEKEVIKSYSIQLDYGRLGIQTFAICLAKITPEGMNEGELEVEQRLQKSPNIINVYRLPSGHFTHVMMFGFRNMGELEEFFHSPKRKEEIHKFIDTKEIFTFSHNSLIKNDPMLLFNKVLDEYEKDSQEFEEIRIFKNRWR